MILKVQKNYPCTKVNNIKNSATNAPVPGKDILPKNKKKEKNSKYRHNRNQDHHNNVLYVFYSAHITNQHIQITHLLCNP